MNDEIELKDVPASEIVIKKYTDLVVFWKCKNVVGKASANWCIQLFRDKSQVPLNGGSFVFYLLHCKNFQKNITEVTSSLTELFILNFQSYLNHLFPVTQMAFSRNKSQSPVSVF